MSLPFVYVLALGSGQAAVENADHIMAMISARLDRHANLHLKYERKVFFAKDLTAGDIRQVPGIGRQWIEEDQPVIWDDNDFYYEHGDYIRYRIDAVNRMKLDVPNLPATTGTREALSAALDVAQRDYDRVYIYDTKANAQTVAYRLKQTGDFLFVNRHKLKPTISVDGLAYNTAGWPPYMMVFSPFISWDSWQKRCGKLEPQEASPGTVALKFDCDLERYTVIVDATRNLPLQFGYDQREGDGYIPLTRGTLSEYTTGTEPFPQRVFVQYFSIDREKFKGTRPPLDAIPMTVTTVDMRITNCEYDNPVFSDKLALSDFHDAPIADYRFTELDRPIHYNLSPSQTDADILAVKKRQDRAIALKKYSRIGTYAVLALAVAVAAGIWIYRGRQNI